VKAGKQERPQVFGDNERAGFIKIRKSRVNGSKVCYML
jgi:hypothetical protein